MVPRILAFLIASLALIELSVSGQSLADLARKEREKKAQEKSPKKVFTNEDLNKYAPLHSASPSAAEPPAKATESSKSPEVSSESSEERAWSKRFIEAKAKLQDLKSQAEVLENKLKDLNLKLMRQSDVYDRENLYGPLIAQTRHQLDQNKTDIAAAQQTLEELRDDLRKSGNPASWENSEAALKPAPGEAAAAKPKIKDQKYWQEQLATIDKRYNELIAPLETERFQLVNRRDVKEGESPTTGPLGLGAPPRVIDIDVQIKELNQKREQERKELVDRAIQEGALPGWFR
jgi:hypothetical protein